MLIWCSKFGLVMKKFNLIHTQPVIIALDVDAFHFKKIVQAEQAGFSIIEMNNVSSDLLKRALMEFPRLQFGVGNVISPEQLEEAYQAGAHFVTSPGLLPVLVQMAEIYQIDYLPSVATMSEAMHAFSLGCRQVRPFPASLSFCSLLNKYLSDLRLFPAEVEFDEVEHFLNLPAVAAVSLINPELSSLEIV